MIGKNWTHAGVLGLLLLLTVINDIYRIGYTVRYMRGLANAVQNPVSVRFGTAVINRVAENAAMAGIKVGDVVLEVNGSRYRGSRELNQVICYARPNEMLELKVRSGWPSDSMRTVRLSLSPRGELASEQWYVLAALFILLPIACQLLGFRAAARRQRNATVWIVLIFSLAFGQMLEIGTEHMEGGLLSSLSQAYSIFLGNTWFAWLLLLSIYFPSRISLDIRLPWAKWLFIVPNFLLTLLQMMAAVMNVYDYSLAATFLPALPLASTLLSYLALISTLLALIIIVFRGFFDPGLDSKRRLRLFYFGTSISILPTMILVIIGRFVGHGLDEFPPPILLPSILAILLFPATLAYAVVIPKAPEVSAIVRQRLYEALSERGMLIVQIALVIFLAVFLFFSPSRSWEGMHAQLLVAVIVLLIILLRPALFTSLRNWIDRNLFKGAYNVEKVLGDFATLVSTLHDMKELLATTEKEL